MIINRRDFLRTTLVGIGLTTIPVTSAKASANPLPLPMQITTRIGREEWKQISKFKDYSKERLISSRIIGSENNFIQTEGVSRLMSNPNVRDWHVRALRDAEIYGRVLQKRNLFKEFINMKKTNTPLRTLPHLYREVHPNKRQEIDRCIQGTIRFLVHGEVLGKEASEKGIPEKIAATVTSTPLTQEEMSEENVNRLTQYVISLPVEQITSKIDNCFKCFYDNRTFHI